MTKNQNKNGVTLGDVAQRAGVNRVTASVVLNGSRNAGTRVSEATRERVMQAAAELRYAPNMLAKSLRNRRTDVFGFYSTYRSLQFLTPYMAHVTTGLQNACTERGKNLLLYGQYYWQTTESTFAQLTGGLIDGLILDVGRPDPLVQLLMESHVPVVALGNRIQNMPSVIANDKLGAQLQARHLAERGHRKVIFRGAPLPVSSVHDRYKAFVAEAKKLGLEVLHGKEENASELSLEEKVWLTLPAAQRPTAIACWCDSSAYSILKGLHEMKLRVPQDIAVIGFDDLPQARSHSQQLSTIHVPWVEAGETAIRVLASLVEGETTSLITRMPVTFVQGETT